MLLTLEYRDGIHAYADTEDITDGDPTTRTRAWLVWRSVRQTNAWLASIENARRYRVTP